MSVTARKALCEALTPLLQIKRFRGKINIQKPKPPHFERAKVLALTKPWFLPQKPEKKLCENLWSSKDKEKKEENPFQQIIAQELKRWFYSSKLIAFCHLNPMSSEHKFNAFVAFKKENMHYKQYGKETLRIALKDTPYEKVLDFYVSHNMIIFSPEPELKKMFRILKKYPQLVLLAGIYENRFLSKDDLVFYSTIPNLKAAQAGFVQTLNSASSLLVQNINTHQTTLVSQLEQIAKKLEEESN